MAIPLTARAPVNFNPPSKPLAKIYVRVPTPFERDNFHAALVRGGIVHYSAEQLRDLMLSGIFALYPEKFDEYRSLMEEFYLAGDEEKKLIDKQFQRLVELEDQNSLLPPAKQRSREAMIEEVEKEIAPSFVFPQSKRVAAAALQMDIRARYEPVQKAFADMAEQDSKRAWLTAEVYVAGWQFPDTERLALPGAPDPETLTAWETPEGNGRGGLQRHEAEYLREKLGAAAWEELAQFIMALHGLDEDEEKNLQSLLATFAAPVGSKPSSTESQASDAGPSKDGAAAGVNGTSGDSTKTRAGGSRKTSSTRSKPIGRSKTKTATSGAIPTAAHT